VQEGRLIYAENQIFAIESLDIMLNSIHKNYKNFDKMNEEMNKFWENLEIKEDELEENTGFFSKFFGSSNKKEVIDEPKHVIIDNEKVTIRSLKEFKKYEEIPAKYKEINEIKGLYIYGSPGCGKTFIMDMFFNNCKLTRKKRTHFNSFMLEVHSKLHKLRSQV